MDHLIVIQYVEKRLSDGKTWTRYKCIPYTDENFDRVKNYVDYLDTVVSDMNLYDNIEKEYFVKMVTMESESNKDFLLGLMSNLVKDEVTVKIYVQGQLLPHEERLEKEGGDIQHHELANQHFGEHSENEKSIGSYI